MKELLVVVDMQNDFITGALGSDAAQNIVFKVCEQIERWQGDIVMTRDTHNDNYMETEEGRMLPVPHCLRYTKGWRINDDVFDSYKEKDCAGSGHFFAIINKAGFGSIPLAEIAQEEQYDRVVICGVCTDICVLSNAILLRSALPEAKIEVLADCCAGVTEQFHTAALSAMERCNIHISACSLVQ